MTVLSINMAKQIQFVGKKFMRNFKPVVEVLDFCESKKVCLLSSGIDYSCQGVNTPPMDDCCEPRKLNKKDSCSYRISKFKS